MPIVIIKDEANEQVMQKSMKTYNEYLDEARRELPAIEPDEMVADTAAGRMLNDLAQHLDRLEKRLESHTHKQTGMRLLPTEERPETLPPTEA